MKRIWSAISSMSRFQKISLALSFVFAAVGLTFFGAGLFVFWNYHPPFGAIIMSFGVIFCSISLFNYKLSHSGVKISDL